jgi:hypothetical protein
MQSVTAAVFSSPWLADGVVHRLRDNVRIVDDRGVERYCACLLRDHGRDGVSDRCRQCRFPAPRGPVGDGDRLWWLERFSDEALAEMARAPWRLRLS